MQKFIAGVITAAIMAAPAAAETLKVTPAQINRLGIRTAQVEAAHSKTVASVLGSIVPALNARIQVSAPFAGTITAFEQLEGEIVKMGDTLAVIASRDARESRAKLQSLQAQYRTAKAAADRARKLAAEGIAPASRAEDAAAREASAAADLAALKEIMARAGTVKGNSGEYHLLAPADGRIAGISLSPGDQVAEMQPVLTIDRGNDLWVEAYLPAAMVGDVVPGNGIEVEGMGIKGEVIAVAATIDPKTRSAILRARVANDKRLVIGQAVRISIMQKAKKSAFSVPREAVVRVGDKSVVFVARKSGFEPVTVTVLARGVSDATISGPLDVSNAVAISGVSELKTLTSQE